jgi:hypothetical protein
VPSIGNISFGLGATGGDSDDGGGGRRWRASGSQCSALGNQRRGRRASGVDVVLAKGLLWCKRAQSGLPR